MNFRVLLLLLSLTLSCLLSVQAIGVDGSVAPQSTEGNASASQATATTTTLSCCNPSSSSYHYCLSTTTTTTTRVGSDTTTQQGRAIASASTRNDLFQTGWIHLNITAAEGTTTTNATTAVTHANASPCAANISGHTIVEPVTTARQERFYAAGYLEGVVLQKQIWNHYLNVGIPTLLAFPEAAHRWTDHHIDWMLSQVKTNRNPNNTQNADDGDRRHHQRPTPSFGSADSSDAAAYWSEVGNVLTQVDGIYQGYASVAPPNESLTFKDIFYINFVFEMPDVVNAVSPPSFSSTSTDGATQRRRGANTVKTQRGNPLLRRPSMPKLGGCSGFIKPTPDGDLFMAQTMWTDYAMMLRVIKRYDFMRDGSPEVLFSSFPATVHSGDDWYSLSNGLGSQETTNSNTNASSFPLTLPESVSEFIRVILSNSLCDDGACWVNTFCQHNSGTYNNQWMIVDFKKFNSTAWRDRDAENGLENGLLYIAEQMPGVCQRADVTPVVRQQGYWASYNIPYFPEVYNVSGARQQYEEYGDYFSYTKYARPMMFKRNQSAVLNLSGVKDLIRYNNWERDPLSVVPAANCTPYTHNPQLAIAARGDLTPWNGYWGDLESFLIPDAFGAIDAKIASYSRAVKATTTTRSRKTQRGPSHKVQEEMDGSQGWSPNGAIISGPTSIQQPVFDWTTYKSFFKLTPHNGQPDRFDFPWVNV